MRMSKKKKKTNPKTECCRKVELSQPRTTWWCCGFSLVPHRVSVQWVQSLGPVPFSVEFACSPTVCVVTAASCNWKPKNVLTGQKVGNFKQAGGVNGCFPLYVALRKNRQRYIRGFWEGLQDPLRP